ncbi:MAG: hypothetical protein AAF141_11920, partial [Pseudomonadota bacterium]
MMNWHIAHIVADPSDTPVAGCTALQIDGQTGNLTAFAYQTNKGAKDSAKLGVTHYRQAARHNGRGMPVPLGLFGGSLEDSRNAIRSHAAVLTDLYRTLAGSAEITVTITSAKDEAEDLSYLRARSRVQKNATLRQVRLNALAADLAHEGFVFRDIFVRADTRCERTSHLDLTCASMDASALMATLGRHSFVEGEDPRLGGPYVPFGTVARAWANRMAEGLPC